MKPQCDVNKCKEKADYYAKGKQRLYLCKKHSKDPKFQGFHIKKVVKRRTAKEAEDFARQTKDLA